ncbi:hypothetical protein HYG93_17715 [Acinetobacter sp. SwsAc6]|uniref:hypothetical protein n=1 Tax=Acinetobacter TaxID=469 RepID=UPI0010C208F0|nr:MULTISPECIES: hypothetical protein [Acinetobacter]NWK76060.1 hypothetical protein [Acinetobacter sp. SwsAc6]QCO21078.1 hypothetical protein C9E88_005930 [Acinetobacter cumulans]
MIYGSDADSIFLQITKDIECPLSFIEDPSERLQLYLDEIKFNTHQQLGNFYQEFIHDCKNHLERINHSQKLEQHQKYIDLVYKILKILDLEGSYNFKERAKPSQYKHLIQERLKNLFTLKKHLLEALESKPNNFWALLNLSHTCLTIYRIQKENNLLSEPSFLQEAENALNKLKTTDEYRNNTNNIISRILYNQACLEALKDNVDSSLNLLEASLKQNQKDTESYFTLRDVETDFDFKNLLMHPKFKELCNQYF